MAPASKRWWALGFKFSNGVPCIPGLEESLGEAGRTGGGGGRDNKATRAADRGRGEDHRRAGLG
jgi:hypothetical protein